MNTCSRSLTNAGAGRGVDQFVLRMPDGMRQQIKEMAAKSRRSMNAEVVIALDHWLKENGQKNAAQ